jgi:hypothetical protein
VDGKSGRIVRRERRRIALMRASEPVPRRRIVPGSGVETGGGVERSMASKMVSVTPSTQAKSPEPLRTTESSELLFTAGKEALVR